MPKVTQHSEEQREFKPMPLCLWSHRFASGRKCLINIWPLNTRIEPLFCHHIGWLQCELGAHLSGICFPFKQMLSIVVFFFQMPIS